jgi:hypothetical protein
LLFLIESRTAHLVAQSRQAMEVFLTREAAEERELAFLESFALGSEPPLRPTIQQLERYAPQWASLVPENPRVQAAVAHRLGEKYEFTYETAPNIRAVMSPCVPPCLYLSVKENDYESEGRRFEYCRARP